MAIGDDFSVAANGDIRHVQNTNTYTVLELHRWLQGLADDAAASGNDLIDITSNTPSERSTDNIITLNSPYNIDDDASKYLYDGSITQNDGDTIYSGLIVVGNVNLSTTLQIVQNNVLYDGDSPFWGTGLNEDAANNVLLKILVKTRDNGVDIDGKRVRVQARTYLDTYAEFSVTMGLGNSTAAIFTSNDLNNTTEATTVGNWTAIKNENEGYNLIDIENGEGDRPYYSKWNKSSYTINQFYERGKYLTRRGETATSLYGLEGELYRGITHEVTVTNHSGNWDAFEPISWSLNGTIVGTGQMLAVNNETNATKIWMQLLTGVVPSAAATILGGRSSAYVNNSGVPTSRTVSPCFLGQSTGAALIGAYGIGCMATQLTNNDKIFDLNNVQQVPPNWVHFTVSGLEPTEDRVLVGPALDGNLHASQLKVNATHNTTATHLEVQNSIPADTPSSGTLRVQNASSFYERLQYTSYSASTFILNASLDKQVNHDANCFISYIDDLSATNVQTFQTVYSSDRSLFIRVRDGGGTPIKTFETPSTLGSAGGAVAVIRTSDE